MSDFDTSRMRQARERVEFDDIIAFRCSSLRVDEEAFENMFPVMRQDSEKA